MTSDTDIAANAAGAIAESLMPGHMDRLHQLFSTHGARAPMIIWSPGIHELQNVHLRRFTEICEDWMDAEGRVPAESFLREALGPLQDWLMVLEPEGESFVYRYYGDRIKEHYGRDMTGETVRTFGGHISEFFEGLYTAVAQRREWVLSEHEPPKSVFVRSWRRLIVPLFANDDETVVQFAVLNVPENELRAGLELMPDPVFVADKDQRVYFANRAAQRMFAIDAISSRGPTLRDLTGISLEHQRSPDDLLTENEVTDSIQLTLNGGIAERLVMTVSGAEHRGTAFYIVVMRLIST